MTKSLSRSILLFVIVGLSACSAHNQKTNTVAPSEQAKPGGKTGMSPVGSPQG